MKRSPAKRLPKPMYGEILIAARWHLRHMNQTDLARGLGVSQSCISKMESDRLEPGAGHLCWIAKEVLGIDLREELDKALAPAKYALLQDFLKKEHNRPKGMRHEPMSEPDCPRCIALIDSERIEKEARAKALAQIQFHRQPVAAKRGGL